MTKASIQQLFHFFNKFNINLSFFFSREILLDSNKYVIIREHLQELKKLGFKSSYLTSLQKSSHTKQKWPLLNLVRQLFKCCGYHLKPERVANGYSKDGKKLFKRFFRIEKIPEKNQEKQEKSVNDSEIENKIISDTVIQQSEGIIQENTQQEEIKEILINE